ncbi:glycosyltransferase family 4 protein [Blastococcus saxobsidens]|uniref:Glycosyl transferase group 1 n=1 Tax=Blastococcus saxobsidens (strain DD2) TaxID=1146883 RepID=H6RSH7_BLASD|nr:glycosyltransferase family 4 protein [Blastococcus saxobsidens]CCG01728.1 Glycosyl transferase group 1 [Blastococcus saxobsidens DD2]
MDFHGRKAVIAAHPHVDLYGSDVMFLESVTAMAPDVVTILPNDGQLAEALRLRGIDVQIKDFPVLRKVELRTPWHAAIFVVRFLRSVVALTAWLRARGAAVVYVSTIAAPEWLLAGRFSGARVVCHLHESEPQMSRLASALLLSPLLAADLVIANSKDSLAWIRSSLGVRAARRSRVIHNGVREPAAPAVADVPDVPPGARSVVVVGRLAARKGQDTAIVATALVRQAGFDVRLTLVGDSYPGYEGYVNGLHELAAREGIREVTDFAGFQDPSPHVAAADVVLVPSRVEPFGLVAVEALLLGRPVIASRVGGLPEVIEDRRTGLLVDPGDPRMLADAIIRLLSDSELAAALGRAGQVEARARFSMATYSAALSEAVLPGS